MKTLLIITATCYFYFAGSQNISNSLQACYPLDVSAQNFATTGSSLNGTLTNVTPTLGHTGAPNTAYQFKGSVGSYIKLPNHPGLKSNSVFFSGWIRIDTLPFLQYLVYTSNGCLNNFEAYSLITIKPPHLNQQVFRLNKCGTDCTTKPEINSSTAPAVGNWYHICFFVSNSALKLYVNGNLESSLLHNVPLGYQPGKEVFLGVTNQSNYNLPFKGAMDNIRFYDRELTQQEVTILYSQDPVCIENTVSLDKLDRNISKINLFPNPTTDRLTIENLDNNTLLIYDVLGNMVPASMGKVGDNVYELNIENFPTGIYFIRLYDQKGRCTRNEKIIKN